LWRPGSHPLKTRRSGFVPFFFLDFPLVVRLFRLEPVRLGCNNERGGGTSVPLDPTTQPPALGARGPHAFLFLVDYFKPEPPFDWTSGFEMEDGDLVKVPHSLFKAA